MYKSISKEFVASTEYKDNNPDLDERLKRILSNGRNILGITTSFEMQDRGRKSYD